MEVNEKLKEVFVVKEFTDKEKIKKAISNWSNLLPNSPIKNLGGLIEIKEANVKEFYKLKMDTFAEIRELQVLTRPFYETVPSERTIFSKNQVDVWAENIPMPDLFSNLEKNQTVYGSERVYDCRACSAKGEIKCYKCSGLGKSRCSGCGGGGQIKCSSCGGKGEKQCPSYCYTRNGQENGYHQGNKRCVTCGGRMFVPCSSCVHGFQNCSTCGMSGQEICSNCSGSGSIKCDTCKGKQQMESYFNINIKFVNDTYSEILNENKLPESFIKELDMSNDYIENSFVKLEEKEFHQTHIESISNKYFQNCFLELKEKSKRKLNSITNSDTNSFIIHRERFCIYRNDNLIEVFFSYKKKPYSIYFYNEFKNFHSINNPIQEISDSYKSEASKLFQNKKYKSAFKLINRSLEIFPNDRDAQELKQKIKDKVILKNVKRGCLTWLILYMIPALILGKALEEDESSKVIVGAYGAFLIIIISIIVNFKNKKYK